MQSNEYSAYDAYDYVGGATNEPLDDESGMLLVPGGISGSARAMDANFEDPKIANMPKILLMGPRRGGKTSIQVSLGVRVTSLCRFPAAVALTTPFGFDPKESGVSKNVATRDAVPIRSNARTGTSSRRSYAAL